jgi:hypothetical protein
LRIFGTRTSCRRITETSARLVDPALPVIAMASGGSPRSQNVYKRFLIGLGVPTPGYAKDLSAEDSCFSDSSSPNEQIVACTALIRSSSLGAKREASALLSRANAFGQKGEYGRAA